MDAITIRNLTAPSERTQTYNAGPQNVILSTETTMIIQWLLFTAVCQTIAVFGIVTNVINIICFVKQGFKDTVNISLLGLAVSDLISLITALWMNLCSTPAFYTLDLPFVAFDVLYLTGALPHVAFTHVSSWITAFITLERCLCIAAPLKIKIILSPARTIAVVISIYIGRIFSLAPEYAVSKLEMKYMPQRNKTILGLVFREDRERIEKPSFLANNTIIPCIPVVIIICCTVTLVVKLQEKTKWRKNNVFHSQTSENVSSRNRKVSKMVVMISTLFIVCYIPITITFLAAAFLPGLAVDGDYVNIVIIISGIIFILESLNSSINIFIYYSMSSKYKITFRQIFYSAI